MGGFDLEAIKERRRTRRKFFVYVIASQRQREAEEDLECCIREIERLRDELA